MSDLYEIASTRDHDRACPGTRGHQDVWITDDGTVSTRLIAYATPANVCLVKTCTHPPYGDQPKFIRIRLAPPSWARWDWLQPKELLF